MEESPLRTMTRNLAQEEIKLRTQEIPTKDGTELQERIRLQHLLCDVLDGFNELLFSEEGETYEDFEQGFGPISETWEKYNN